MDNSDPTFDPYYVFKGLTKAIPIAGPVLEEIIFNQYESELARSNDFDELYEKITLNVNDNKNEIKRVLNDYMMALYKKSIKEKNSINESQREIKIELESIKGILNYLSDDASTLATFKGKINEIEKERMKCISRLSSTQKKIHSLVSRSAESSEYLFERLFSEIPDLKNARPKELHFRLHELRYLGLIMRIKPKDEFHWYYWRE